MELKDRVKEFRRVKADLIRKNPRNFRQHTPEQRAVLRGVLDEVGFAGAVLVREVEDGGLELIDGELRVEESGDAEVPVLVLDVTEQEASMLLASYDGITGMASVAAEQYHALLLDLKPKDADLRRFVADRLSETTPDDQAVTGTVGSPEGPHEMELVPHEHYDYVIVLARNVHQWNRMAELLGLSLVKKTRTQIGVGRGIEAETLIKLLEGSNGNVSSGSAKSKAPEEHGADTGDVA